MSLAYEPAAYSVCRAIAERDDDTGWTLVNLWGAAVPEAAEPWVKRVGPHAFIPACIAAKIALGHELPEKESEPA